VESRPTRSSTQLSAIPSLFTDAEQLQAPATPVVRLVRGQPRGEQLVLLEMKWCDHLRTNHQCSWRMNSNRKPKNVLSTASELRTCRNENEYVGLRNLLTDSLQLLDKVDASLARTGPSVTKVPLVRHCNSAPLASASRSHCGGT
jgi:hypothetical protein